MLSGGGNTVPFGGFGGAVSSISFSVKFHPARACPNWTGVLITNLATMSQLKEHTMVLLLFMIITCQSLVATVLTIMEKPWFPVCIWEIV